MAKFAIDKTFDHARVQVKESNNILEIIRLDDTDFGVVLYRDGKKPEELGVYTLEELRAIYRILSQ